MFITPAGRALALLVAAALFRDGAPPSSAAGDRETGERQPRAIGHVLAPAQIVPGTDQRKGALSLNAYRPSFFRICRVTAYRDRGITAAGIPSGIGQCAAPADIPFGSIIRIPALNRSFIVTDRTHKRFRHNTVDLFMPDRNECLEFGVNFLECEIFVPHFIPRYGSLQLQAAVAWIRSVAG